MRHGISGRLGFAFLFTLCGFPLPCSLAGDAPSRFPVLPTTASGLNYNVPTPTLGGRQLWADVHYFHDWRIQQNCLTKHYRLLDGNDVRQAWGTLEQCELRLNQIRVERNLPEMSGDAVILVHGIGRSSKSFSRMKSELQDAGFAHVIGFDFPSTRVDIQTSAAYLHHAVSSLKGVERVHFVTHSLGGLIVREYLASYEEPRTGRLVMLGTPNHGANLADWFRLTPPYYVILGPAGQQLGANPNSYIRELPVPGCEFAVIAGGRGAAAPALGGVAAGYNPLIPGDDDAIVSVHSALLEGACDSMILPVLHADLPHDQSVCEHTVRFLTKGRLRANAPRQPVVAVKPRNQTPKVAAPEPRNSRPTPAD